MRTWKKEVWDGSRPVLPGGTTTSMGATSPTRAGAPTWEVVAGQFSIIEQNIALQLLYGYCFYSSQELLLSVMKCGYNFLYPRNVESCNLWNKVANMAKTLTSLAIFKNKIEKCVNEKSEHARKELLNSLNWFSHLELKTSSRPIPNWPTKSKLVALYSCFARSETPF